MNTMVKKLYFGEFSHHEKSIPRTKEMQMLIKKHDQYFDTTVALLKEHDIENAEKLLDNLLNSCSEIDEIEKIDAFQDGIKLGLSLGILLAE